MRDHQQKTATELFCKNEYGKLAHVLMCPPTYMRIEEVINNTQTHYAKENINPRKAVAQFDSFLRVLQREGIEVELLSPVAQLPEQVFTRDIGFVIGECAFLSNMYHPIRQQETWEVEKFWEERGLTFQRLQSHIEGGDLFVDEETIWLGVGGRTLREAAKELQRRLPEHEVVPIEMRAEYLHLDCVFNVVAPDIALVYREAIPPMLLERLKRRYELVAVTEHEQFCMGTNMLSLGDGKVVSQPQNQRINETLLRLGLDVLEVDISEIIKSGGAFRCMTFPLRREC